MEPVKNILPDLAISAFLIIVAGCATSDVMLSRHIDSPAVSVTHAVADGTKKVDSGSELNLDSLLDYALENSHELKSIHARWQAAVNQAPQVASLPDPQLTYGYFIESVQTKTGAQDQKIGISQKVPWFGKLSLKEEMALKQAEAVAQEYDAAVRGLVSKVKKSYYEYTWLYDAIQINREHINLLRVVESVASIRFKSSKISQSTLIQIQVEQGKIEDRVKELESLKTPLSNSIYAALGSEPGQLLSRPAVERKALIDLNLDELQLQMTQANPELKRITALKEKQALAVRLADKNYYPDLTFGLSYIDIDGGNDPTLALVSINLPIWRKSLDAAKREAVNRRRSVSESLIDTRLELFAKLDLLIYYYQNALRKNKLYKNTLIPKAQQSIDLAVTGFETGSVSFADLLNAERTLLEFQLDAKRHAADASQRLAEIHALVAAGSNQSSEK